MSYTSLLREERQDTTTTSNSVLDLAYKEIAVLDILSIKKAKERPEFPSRQPTYLALYDLSTVNLMWTG